MSNSSAAVGVVVARFQVAELTNLHSQLVKYVVDNHEKRLIILGVAKTGPTRENPLDFLSRKYMVESLFPNDNLIVLPLTDSQSDYIWSSDLDAIINSMVPGQSVVLYGGRDSFKKYYHGKFQISSIDEDILSLDDVSGTRSRANTEKANPRQPNEYVARWTDILKGLKTVAKNL